MCISADHCKVRYEKTCLPSQTAYHFPLNNNMPMPAVYEFMTRWRENTSHSYRRTAICLVITSRSQSLTVSSTMRGRWMHQHWSMWSDYWTSPYFIITSGTVTHVTQWLTILFAMMQIHSGWSWQIQANTRSWILWVSYALHVMLAKEAVHAH